MSTDDRTEIAQGLLVYVWATQTSDAQARCPSILYAPWEGDKHEETDSSRGLHSWSGRKFILHSPGAKSMAGARLEKLRLQGSVHGFLYVASFFRSA